MKITTFDGESSLLSVLEGKALAMELRAARKLAEQRAEVES